MSAFHFLKTGAQVLVFSAVLSVVFAAGLMTGGRYFPLAGQPSPTAEADAHSGHSHGGGSTGANSHQQQGIVSLSKQAYDNLQLKMGLANTRSYWKSVLVPGRIVEIPGRSNLTVSAPVTGVIEQIKILPGESLTPKQTLFTLRITDDALIDAQSRLLGLLTQQSVNQQEIDRLQPLIASGAVAGSQKRELEYRQQHLKTQQLTVRQELQGRGLPTDAILNLVQTQQLVTQLAIYSPDYVNSENSEGTMSSGYSVESMQVHPGQTVVRGEALCEVAFHTHLYIEGSAFEADLPTLNRILDQDWSIVVEVEQELDHGKTGADHQHFQAKLLRIDNHIEEASQTVRFYLELKNLVTHRREQEEKTFELWKFRPGQRLHLRLPTEQWQGQLVMDKQAVAVDGPNVYVFRQHVHEHAPGEEHDHEEPFLELEAVSVKLLHRDDQSVVIDMGEQLSVGDVIATNNGNKLYLAMKMQSGAGGGGHSHDHPH